jgi:DUF1680 family protein
MKIGLQCLKIGAILTASATIASAQPGLTPVGFSQVKIDDGFWKPRMDKVSTVTLQACINYTEFKTSRIRNFERAASKNGQHEGIYYDDSDVYKALEAMAYSLRIHPDPVMEKKADEWIDKIARAQLPDGYLDTYFQLRDINKRWTDMEKHEDYNAGHLIEAGVAYYNSTGKRVLLDVAIRLANHIDSTFRLSGRNWVSGHEEIELALMKLYHLTNNDRYLKLAHWYLEERGHGYGSSPVWNGPKSHEYYQDDRMVRDADKIKGHAVRAMYLYTGTADVAAVTHDPDYLKAMERIWEDVVYRNMYVTGGIGSSGNNEGFTVDYDLPNVDAYCETCASVGMVIWNQRMNLLTGESKYIDVLERTLYNAALDGLSLGGDLFFYGNPLASGGQYGRSEWFGTACCPANIARLVASLGNYIYNQSEDGFWVNLFVGSKTEAILGKSKVKIEQQTNYPWDGQVQMNITTDKKSQWDLHVRIPGWALGSPVPGDLYHFTNYIDSPIHLQVNGKDVDYRMEKGYAVISRQWKNGDQLTMNFPMPVNEVAANPLVKADEGRVALQRGPLIYCVEGSDNQGQAWTILLPANAKFTSSYQKDLLNGIVSIQADLPVIAAGEDGLSVITRTQKVTAIPYFVWCNRAADPMQVWIPQKIKDIKINY